MSEIDEVSVGQRALFSRDQVSRGSSFGVLEWAEFSFSFFGWFFHSTENHAHTLTQMRKKKGKEKLFPYFPFAPFFQDSFSFFNFFFFANILAELFLFIYRFSLLLFASNRHFFQLHSAFRYEMGFLSVFFYFVSLHFCTSARTRSFLASGLAHQ